MRNLKGSLVYFGMHAFCIGIIVLVVYKVAYAQPPIVPMAAMLTAAPTAVVGIGQQASVNILNSAAAAEIIAAPAASSTIIVSDMTISNGNDTSGRVLVTVTSNAVVKWRGWMDIGVNLNWSSPISMETGQALTVTVSSATHDTWVWVNYAVNRG